ncbi:gamma-glutamyltransferase (plasmid) [Halostagnicola larsenii XH-48]|uniref:Gamma-glutamyltransferase n=1 Tax=Halostagnicola larsenii XH-48 TaxID=797299 RepID=W0JZB6_9EURY|nr:gamma-glutamyltransferase [Halostagnicola larsenii]AHG02293.1 gamma-glutamyltransferase [Halostagnicola larsenii XH-48]
MTRQPPSQVTDRTDGSTADASRINRRTLLTTIGVTAGALGIGSSTTAADVQPVTDVPGFSCGKRHFTCGREVAAADGMVSSVDPIASGVAATILRKGGNAVDAAVALQYTLNVTQPHGSGIGGGGFMVIYDAAADEITCVNSRERAPRGAEPDMFLDEDGDEIPFDQRHQSGDAVGVPGTLKGLETARKLYGSRPRQQLIGPAIKLARKGFTVDDFLAEQIAENWWKFNDAAKETFSTASGEPLGAGDRLVNADLADTLALIKRGGTDPFYEGEIAADLVETVRELGGTMTTDDMADYDITLDDPVRKDWYDVEIVGQPLPSSGPSVVAMALKMLEFCGIENHELRSPEMYHLVAEAITLAWADRMEYMGDPEFADVPIDGLLDDDYLAKRAGEIRMGDSVAANGCADPGVPPGVDSSGELSDSGGESGATTHFSVVDKHGNAVSYTSTIEQFMGSGKMVPGRGFMLNNELTDFDAEPGGPNEVQPWKRPLSSMSPTMVLNDGVPEFTAGSPGGWTIVSVTAQTLLYRYVYGLDPLESVVEPAIYTYHCSDVEWDSGVPERARETTAEWGHDWDDEASTLGNVQVIDIGEDELIGAADPNRDGQAVGFDRGGCR